jgi:hypothetical protein
MGGTKRNGTVWSMSLTSARLPARAFAHTAISRSVKRAPGSRFMTIEG